jgi:adenylate cyclase
MAQEIERKFLLANDQWRALATSRISIKQGFLSSKPEATVRVRLADGKGTLTIKSKTEGISRAEYEYDIPAEEATELLALCSGPLLEKTRYIVAVGNHTWEIDEFSGDNDGLFIAEIELTSEYEPFEKSEWLGLEVSGDVRYYNSSLVQLPFCKW